MIFFLLPLLFSPFGFVASWLPALYLAIWPVIIQKLGSETLVTHALMLIIFIITCDITRQTMLKLIGFDLLSFPIGLALLAALVTDKGALFLSIIRPPFSGLLTVVEPLFLLIEIYLIMDMIRSFNKWISKLANIRDEESQDLSWDPPLARVSIIMRIIVILITIFSYIGVYLIIQESKILLGPGVDIPVNFNHAIAILVTLQLIAFSATIYKEEGILSESALVILFASIPIFISSWSYYHLKETTLTKSSLWTSYFPFTIFSSTDDELGHQTDPHQPFAVDESNCLILNSLGDQSSRHHIDFRPLEESVNQIEAMDGLSKQLLLSFLRRLIMIINSILGLSMDKLAKYYFGPDFWYILTGRLACLSWWVLISSRRPSDNEWQNNQENLPQNYQSTLWQRIKTLWLSVCSWLPISKTTLIKVLLVLTYSQMLNQQMDNRYHLQEQTSLLTEVDVQYQLIDKKQATACCFNHQTSTNPGGQLADESDQQGNMVAWFSCMWSSAKACNAAINRHTDQPNQSRAARFLDLFQNGIAQIMASLMGVTHFIYRRLTNLDLLLYSVQTVWLARWRSPIVQRLCQSMLIQIYYISSLFFTYE